MHKQVIEVSTFSPFISSEPHEPSGFQTFCCLPRPLQGKEREWEAELKFSLEDSRVKVGFGKLARGADKGQEKRDGLSHWLATFPPAKKKLN